MPIALTIRRLEEIEVATDEIALRQAKIREDIRALEKLTPAQLIADIKSLDRLEHDWLIEGRLDSISEADIKAKRAELLDDLRERFTTGQNENFIGHGDSWFAHEGDMDCDLIGNVYVPVIPVAYGNTEIEAIETLLEMIGEDA